MDVSIIINALIAQRRRCCSFDSPGLARNEPTPGGIYKEIQRHRC